MTIKTPRRGLAPRNRLATHFAMFAFASAAPAFAQNSGLELEEIIVTGAKRVDDQQDLGMSVYTLT